MIVTGQHSWYKSYRCTSNFWQEQVIFLFSQTSRSSLEPTHWGINLTNHLHLVLSLRMHGSVPLLPCRPSRHAQKLLHLCCSVWCSRQNLWDWKQLLVSCNEHGILWLHQRQKNSPENLSIGFSGEILVCSSLHSIKTKCFSAVYSKNHIGWETKLKGMAHAVQHTLVWLPFKLLNETISFYMVIVIILHHISYRLIELLLQSLITALE